MRSRGASFGAVVALLGIALASCTAAEGSSAVGQSTPLSTTSSEVPADPGSTSTTEMPAPVAATSTAVPPPLFPHFEVNEYGSLLDAVVLPDTTIQWPPGITGDESADARIRVLADQRGYRPRPVTQATLVAEAGVLVHPTMAGDLRALLDEARFWGMHVEVSSGYRSVDRQREIFQRELREQGVATVGRELTSEEIASGAADLQVLEVLRWHSMPGYSRHHSGFTVDFELDGTVTAFEGSPAEEWLRADDFANAKRFGFVPSYPRGSAPLGPDPEPWEYVHVGTGNIQCAALHTPMRDADAAASCPLVD